MEKDIVRSVQVYLRGLPDCFCFKEHGSQYSVSGIPDIICCHKGRFVALEVKRPGRKPTKLQAATMERIRNAGGVAEVVTSVDDTERVLRRRGGGGEHDDDYFRA